MKRRNFIRGHFSVGVSLPARGPSQGQDMGGPFFSLPPAWISPRS